MGPTIPHRLDRRPSSRIDTPTPAVYPYEVTALLERGWWVLHVADLDVRGVAATLAEVRSAAELLLARALDAPVGSVPMTISVVRFTRGSLIRSRW